MLFKSWLRFGLLLILSLSLSLGIFWQPSQMFAQAPTPTFEERVTEGVYLNQEGYNLFQQGQAQGAIETFNRALTIFQELKAPAGVANSNNHIGEVYLALGQYDKALEYFQKALTIWRELSRLPDGETANVGYTLQYIGETYGQIHEFDQAIAAYDESLRIFSQLLTSKKGDPDSLRVSQQVSYSALGAIYFRTGEYPKALQNYEQVLVIQREINDKVGQSYTLNNIGVLYANTSQYAKALETYQQALAILQDLSKDGGVRYLGQEAAIFNNLSALFFTLGDTEQATDYARQAAELHQKWSSDSSSSGLVKGLELLQDTLGSTSVNSNYFTQGLAVHGTINEGSQGDKIKASQGLNFNNLGQIYSQQGDLEKALEFYEKALANYREIENRWAESITLNNVGQVYAKLGQYDKAIALYQQAIALYAELKDKAGRGVGASNLADVYQRQGDLNKALASYQEALQIHRELGDQGSSAIALRQIGAILLQQKKAAEATKVLQEGITLFESLSPGLNDASKVSLFEQGNLIYRHLQQALIAQNKINEALEISERGRARAFVELMASRLNLTQAIKPLTINDIKTIAKEQKATLVEYSIIGETGQESELYIWVIKPTGEISFQRSDLKPILTANDTQNLTTLVVKSRNYLLGRRGEEATAEIFSQLYNLLIKPINEQLPKDESSQIIFIPQGPLFLIPFPALVDENGTYLINSHTILTAPSIQVLGLTYQLPHSKSNGIIIVGNPTMPDLPEKLNKPPVPLIPLPGAEEEAKEIGQLLKTEPMIGDVATELAVTRKMPEAKIIHLATHGLLDEFKVIGPPGSLALTPGQGQDGFLTTNEILNLKLQADLVVLSACDTGRGKITGDGVIGLSRGFLGAGARSTIVSLWAVPDRPTAVLMQEFYRQWQQNPNKAKALRQAMLATEQQFSAPKNWAAFTLLGEID